MPPSSFSPALSRRDAIKTLGAGAALIGLSSVLRATPDASAAASGGGATTGASETPQPFALPKLGYEFGALEPYIDAHTMELHYTKHHQAYITNATKALAEHTELHALTAEQMLRDLGALPEKVRTTLRNNVGGHVNHSLFWRTIGPHAGGAPGGELAAAIAKEFGSFDGFKQKFGDAALKCFGSGWAWLSVAQGGKLKVHSTPNQDSPLSTGEVPLAGLDVWEHAYYLNYQNRRAEYIAAYWDVVNWTEVEANYRAAKA